MKKLFVALLLMVAINAQAQTIICRPDGNGGMICKPYPQCMPGTVC